MKELPGATLVAVLMIVLVAIAILVPVENGSRETVDLTSGSNERSIGDASGLFTPLEKNEIRNTVRE